MISVDTETSGGVEFYVDDVLTNTATASNDTIGFSNVNSCSFGDTAARASVADLWMSFGEYIDPSIDANRRKFIDEAGNPVFLGSDGSLPTGSAPDIFLSGAIDSWHTNKGTGGGFTENGELTDAITKPGEIYAAMPTDGLIGWWKLDEISGNSVIDYASSNNLVTNFDIQNASISGTLGRGFDFDGVNDVLTGIPFTGGELGTVHAFSFWARWDTPSETVGFGLGSNACTVVGFETGGGLIYRLPPCTIVATVMPSNDFSEWNHYSIVRSDLDVDFYINGALVGSDTLSANNSVSIDRFGARSFTSAHFDGQADDLRIYDRALGSNEVQALYDAALCANPERLNGTIVYNADFNVMQYCDALLPGNGWQAITP